MLVTKLICNHDSHYHTYRYTEKTYKAYNADLDATMAFTTYIQLHVNKMYKRHLRLRTHKPRVYPTFSTLMFCSSSKIDSGGIMNFSLPFVRT